MPNERPDATIGPDLDDMPDDWKGIFGVDEVPADAVRKYREFALSKSELERQAEGRDKTGVFTGVFATNPTNGASIPIFVADYVLMGYGTGAIMAVPCGDQRDFEFATKFGLPIPAIQQPPDAWFAERGIEPTLDTAHWPEAFTGDAPYVQSANDELSLNGIDNKADGIATINAWLEAHGVGKATINYKLRDWLFSRQRYWGEPFPIVYDVDGRPHALPESLLPVVLPVVMISASTVLNTIADAEGAARFKANDITDWPALTADLAAAAESDTPSPARRLMGFLEQTPAGPILTSGNPLSDDERDVVIAGLNRVISRRDVYDAESFAPDHRSGHAPAAVA